ncbi:MAG: sigma-70 family RNA polymerase sigma factor [Bacteroidota bacterium]
MESTPQASPPSDADLLQAYRDGDARAFEQLLRRYEKPLFTFIARMVADRDEAEDVYQDTLSRVVEKIQSYDERGKFGSWLFGIAHHLCVDRSRRKARWKFILSDEVTGEKFCVDEKLKDPTPLPDTLVEQKELSEMITEALQRLSSGQREVFLLRQHSDLSFREIAGMLNRPLNTVLGQMHGAVISIRALLREKMK